MRRDHLNVERLKVRIQRVRVIRLVANQPFGLLVGESLDKSFSDKSGFMRRSGLRVDGDRKTSAVCHYHELRTCAPLGFSDFAAPFLATINVPSIKHSYRSNSPRVRRSSAKVSNMRSSRPSLTHCRKRRRQVWYGGNLSGKSHQRAPERRIQSTPFKISRAQRCGLPRVWMLCGLSNSDSIKDHCSSDSSSRRAIMQI